MPEQSAPKPVAIIGAGIVGVSTAIWLQRAGINSILLDRGGPAAGTSFGNAGVLASASVVPVTVPGLIGKAPRMALDKQQPLFLNWSYLPQMLPWLARYLSHCKAEK
ncbi:MAG: FAD-dependent oxidoreductase, partial [Pseudomonadota bacterium]